MRSSWSRQRYHKSPSKRLAIKHRHRRSQFRSTLRHLQRQGLCSLNQCEGASLLPSSHHPSQAEAVASQRRSNRLANRPIKSCRPFSAGCHKHSIICTRFTNTGLIALTAPRAVSDIRCTLIILVHSTVTSAVDKANAQKAFSFVRHFSRKLRTHASNPYFAQLRRVCRVLELTS